MRKLITRAILSGLVLLALAGAAVAQAPPASPASPAPGGAARFDAQAATDAYMATLSPEKRARSDAYFEGGYWLTLWDLLYGLGVAWILLGTRLSARMRDLAERLTRFRPLQTFLYAVQYILATALLSLPLGIYEGFFREHQYGMSNQTFAAWAGEWLKGIGLGLVLGGLALTALYGVLRKAPRTWWLWGALVSLLFLVVGIALGPVYIEPMFNKYTELRDPTAARSDPVAGAGERHSGASTSTWSTPRKQTKRVSANVAGLFGTTRIALNDNLLNRTSPAGVKAVMGHEMGHYVLNHVTRASSSSASCWWPASPSCAGPSTAPRPAGESAGGSAAWRSRRPAAARRAVLALLLRADPADQHPHPDGGVGGRHLRPQRRPRAGRLRRGGPAAQRVPQARPRAGRGVDLLRPPERAEPDLDGDAVEGGASGGPASRAVSFQIL